MTTTPDRDAVVAMIRELEALPDSEFRDALADNLNDPDPVETAAFRSGRLVQRTIIAAQSLINQTNALIKREAGESNKALTRRRLAFIELAGVERRTCQTILDGIRAQQGKPPSNAPNPRARAARELQRRHPQEYLELVRHYEKVIREENRARKEARKAQRRKR